MFSMIRLRGTMEKSAILHLEKNKSGFPGLFF